MEKNDKIFTTGLLVSQDNACINSFAMTYGKNTHKKRALHVRQRMNPSAHSRYGSLNSSFLLRHLYFFVYQLRQFPDTQVYSHRRLGE